MNFNKLILNTCVRNNFNKISVIRGGNIQRNHCSSILPRNRTLCTNKVPDASETSPNWNINMLYDSECPLCMHEVRFLQKRDKNSKIKFTDIADPSYDPSQNGNVDYETGMKRIYAVKSDGSVISGVEVFKAVYDQVGLGWLFAVTRIPWVGKKAEVAYMFWANWRMWITGRPELEQVFEERRKMLEECQTDKCNIDVKQFKNKL